MSELDGAFDLPADWLTTVSGHATAIVGDVWPFAALVLGILLLVLIVSAIIPGSVDDADDH